MPPLDDAKSSHLTAGPTLPDSTARRTLFSLRVVSLLTLLSRITGLMRDSAMAVMFGNNLYLDTFALAFRLPNAARRLFGDGAVAIAILPSFLRAEAAGGRAAASALLQRVLRRTVLLLSGGVLCLIAVLLAAEWIWFPVSERTQLLVELSAILLPYIVLISAAAIFAASLNALNRFAVSAAIPIVLNLVWIAGIAIVAALWATDQQRIMPIAVVVLLGGVAQVVMSVIGARRAGIQLRPQLNSSEMAGVTRETAIVFRTAVPILAGLSVMQINSVVDSVMAWLLSSQTVADLRLFGAAWFHLPEGSTAALYFGQRIFQFPIGIFGVALGAVLFPQFARHAELKDRDALREDLAYGLRLVLLVGLPAGVGLWLVSLPATDVLFRYGSFDANDALQTSQMIAAYGSGVVTACLLLIVMRVFYACGDQSSLRAGIVSVAANLLLNFLMVPFWGAPGLALASVLAATIQLVFLAVSLQREHCPLPRRHLLGFLVRCLMATVVMTGAGLAVNLLIPGQSDTVMFRLLRLVAPVVICSVVYAAVLRLLGIRPLQVLKGRIRQRT